MDTNLQAQQKRVIDALLKQRVLVTKEIATRLNDPMTLAALSAHITTGAFNTTSMLHILNTTTINHAVHSAKPVRPENQTAPNGIQLMAQQGPRAPSSEQSNTPAPATVEVVIHHEANSGKRALTDYTKLFLSRYETLGRLIRQRQEFSGAVSINRLQGKNTRENVAIIGYVLDKQETKNHNYILTLEDPTGTIKVIVGNKRPETFAQTKDIQLDEVIGVTGMLGGDAVFANTIAIPDVPLTNELKKAPDDACVALIPDVHVGSRLFCKEGFQRFIEWLNGNWGTQEQRALASKVRYVFLVGDTIDGIGVYPGHEQEIDIKDVYQQYELLANQLRKIPQHISIIICPGDHDAVRLAEPQPKHDPDFSKSLYTIPNVTLLSNPALVRIHKQSDFPGFLVLMYHGVSFTHYADMVDSIRNSGKNSSERTELVLRYLLQRRHLAPTYGSTQYIPETTTDALCIETLPDIIFSGHIHKITHSTYRGVTLLSGGCFQYKTSYQVKFGHEPDPACVPILNLATRTVTILNFEETNAAPTVTTATQQASSTPPATKTPTNDKIPSPIREQTGNTPPTPIPIVTAATINPQTTPTAVTEQPATTQTPPANATTTVQL